MLTIGVLVSSKLAILLVTATAAPSGSTFFWMGFCIITWMGVSSRGPGSLDLGCVIGGTSISFWRQTALIDKEAS